MAYNSQTELELLIQQCDHMEESINSSFILALNYIDDPTEAYNDSSVNIHITDECWIKFCQDFDTFFKINADYKHRDEFETLKKRTRIVNKDVLASVRVLINAIKNDLKVKEATGYFTITDSDKFH